MLRYIIPGLLFVHVEISFVTEQEIQPFSGRELYNDPICLQII